MANQRVTVPDIGSDDPVDVIEWLVAEGDQVAVDDSLVVLESAKASVEVPSPVAGRVVTRLVDEGARVSTGDALLEVAVASVDTPVAGPASADAPPTDRSVAASTTEAEAVAPATSSSVSREASSVGEGVEEITVTIPDIGSDDPLEVIEVLVSPGHHLTEDESLVVLESAKASVEVPSPVAGELIALQVTQGDSVTVGDPLATVRVKRRTPEETVSEALDGLAMDSDVTTPPATTTAPPDVADVHENPLSAPVHAGPAVRKLARQLGVDLAQVPTAGGNNRRITKDDVYAFVKQTGSRAAAPTPPALPEIDFSRFGEVERVARSRLQRTAAANLQAGWQQIPLVTQHDVVDITALEAFRRAENGRQSAVKLTLLAFVARAVTSALKAFPTFNSSLSADGTELILKHYIHLGVAVDTDRGLLVPVLQNADRLGVNAIAREVAELAAKARDKRLMPAEMQGASFTLTSLGGIGGTAFTPLVNAPQVAILGISRADWQPVWQPEAASFEPRLLLPLSLSYDHRVIDGADGARFMVYLRDCLADVRRLLL